MRPAQADGWARRAAVDESMKRSVFRFVMPALVAGIHDLVENQKLGWHRKSGLPDFRII
jgi:hypothetical protein